MDFIIKVKEVKGFCPVYETDDKFTLKVTFLYFRI